MRPHRRMTVITTLPKPLRYHIPSSVWKSYQIEVRNGFERHAKIRKPHERKVPQDVSRTLRRRSLTRSRKASQGTSYCSELCYYMYRQCSMCLDVYKTIRDTHARVRHKLIGLQRFGQNRHLSVDRCVARMDRFSQQSCLSSTIDPN